MPEKDLKFCQEAVSNYNRLKSVILDGDFYRLVSPYEGEHMAVMTVGGDLSKAVVYTYNIHPRMAENLYPVHLQGLDPNKMYKVEEINLMPGEKSRFRENGEVFSGDYLMKVGLRAFTTQHTHSRVFELTAQ